LNGHPHTERGRADLTVQSPQQEPTEGALSREKGSSGAGPGQLSSPINQSILFNKKVASSEAFTLVIQFWPLLAERSNYAQIKLFPKVLLELYALEKQQTKIN
jgi:hypothetical protein